MVDLLADLTVESMVTMMVVLKGVMMVGMLVASMDL